MSERVPAQNKTSATPSQATPANSPLLRRPLTSEISGSVGSNSNISQELGGIQAKTIRRSLNWQNITVEAPSRGNGMSLPGGIQRQQEEQEGTPAIEHQVSAKKAETSTGELSNLTKATEGPLQPKVDRPRLNWRNITVEAPARSGKPSSQPIQRQQEEQQETPEIQAQLAADSVQKSALESSNSTISTSEPAQKPLIAPAPFNGQNIPIEAPASSAASSTYPGGIQRLETSGVMEQEKSPESLQMQPEEEIHAKSNEGKPQEKEEPNQELVQTKLTVGAPGDKYEQEADSMAAKVMTMPDSAIQQSIQRQTRKETEAVQMQPLVNSITPMVQRSSGEQEEVQMKSGAQRASGGSSQASSSIESQLASSKGGGSALPDNVRRFMEPRFGADFSQVRVHTGSEAVKMNRDLNAQAFTHQQDVYFGNGKSPANDALTAHELTHVIQQASTTSNIASMAVQRKEVQKDHNIQGKQDWTTADRENNTQRWKDACLINLNKVNSSQYRKVVERRDFYKWFYEYTASRGYTTRWALAAYVVSNGAHQVADMDLAFINRAGNDTFGIANIELQGAMREGNQIIFDNVLPKLKKLLDGGQLKGKAALNWDMQVLAEEQALIQPMYLRMSKQTLEKLNSITRKKGVVRLGAAFGGDKIPEGKYNKAGKVPGFDLFNNSNIQNIGDRWRYGMVLGDQFTPGGTGFDPNKHKMPKVGSGYKDGTELAKVDTRPNLHKLDAWLNPNRFSRSGSGSDIHAIIKSLTKFEKQQVLRDRSPDGWFYSIQFAQFRFITEAMVRQSLPTSASAAAIAAFLTRYKAERDVTISWTYKGR